MINKSQNLIDKLLIQADQALRTTHAKASTSERINPAESIDIAASDTLLSEEETRLSAQLMRINHAGEIAAQGLYRGTSANVKI